MKILLLTVLLAISQASTPVPRQAADNAAGGRQNVHNHTNSQQTPPAQPKPIPDATTSTINEQKSQAPSSANTGKAISVGELAAVAVAGKDWWDKAYVIFTGLLVGIGAVGVRYAIKSLGTIERQAKANEDTLAEIKAAGQQTDKMIAHAGKQAEALFDAAATARKQAEIADISARAMLSASEAALMNAQVAISSERPWIVVTASRSKSMPIRWFFEAKNQGRTPAKIVSEEIGDVFVAQPVEDLPVPPQFKPSVIHEGLLVGGKDFRSHVVEPEAFIFNRGMKDSQKLLCVFGRIRYKDFITSEHDIHETLWCFVYMAQEKIFVMSGPDEYNNYT